MSKLLAMALVLAGAPHFETQHDMAVAGHRLRYRAVVSEYVLQSPAGKPAASIIATSYLRTDVPQGAVRPVVFVFNGGPGSASLWLQLGLVGPRRIELHDPVHPPTTAPFHLVDNEETLLDVADIVLLDPPGTGFSRILPDGKPEEFYGVAQDAQASVEFIEQWLRENDRWNSPKYILAESYGTVRAAVVARLLAGGPMSTGSMDGVTLNGVVLLGQSMDMSGSAGKDAGYANALPSMAATACYHHKVAASCTPEGQAEAAREFNSETYVKALYAGHRLEPKQRDAVARRLAELTGLPAPYIEARDLRVGAGEFAHQLLADQRQSLGLYDGRFVLPSEGDGKDPVADDPAMAQYVPAFVAAYNTYARDELKVTLPEPYQAIEFRSVNMRWDWGGGPPGDYAPDLATAMRRNPHLRLMIGAGYYDLVTPLGNAEYLLAHSDIPAAATEIHYYASGHMPYLGDESRRELARDLKAFLAK